MNNQISNILNIEKPIIQGPMFWLTNAEFVAAVSNSGALGVLGINAGQYEPTKSINKTIEQMREQIKKTQKLTNKPFGLNLVLNDEPDKDIFAEPMIKLMIQEKVPVAVIYSTKYIPKWFDMLKENHIKIVYRPATPTKNVVEEAIQKGIDVLVATGFDEGGTIPDHAVGTFSAIPYLDDIVNKRVPLMAAGGIVDKRTTKAALDLGANGIFVGTAFLATKESPMSDKIKTLLTKHDAYDELLFKALPKYYRSIPGVLPEHLVELSEVGRTNKEVWNAANGYSGMRTGMLLGDLENGYASFGLGLSMIHEITTVNKVIEELYNGFNN